MHDPSPRRPLVLLLVLAVASSLASCRTAADGEVHTNGEVPVQDEVPAPGEGWTKTGDRTVPRVRLAAEILDSQPAVLEAEVETGEQPYSYTVDWNDGSPPEVGRRHAGGRLRLTHDYDLISTYQVVLEVGVGGETSRIEVPPVAVKDDDDEVPELTWTLPDPVLRPGEPAIVRWRITDESGLAFVSVVLQGPGGRLDAFDTPEGEIDLAGRGLGQFGIEVQALDGDRDRPNDALGYMLIESVTITDDSDGDGRLDHTDNCPREKNSDQLDSDHDGLGDLCDPCPRVNGPCEREPDGGGGDPAAALVSLLLLPGISRRRPQRRLRVRPLHRLGLVLTAALVAGPALGAPAVSSVRPTATLVGEPVVIFGTGFGTSQGANGRVTFGGVDAGTVYHWTDTRITVEVPIGSLGVGGVPTPTPTGPQPVVVRNNAGEVSGSVQIDIKVFNLLPPFRRACRCGECPGPCLPDDYCRRRTGGGCTFETRAFRRRDIKDVDFGDVDNDGDLDILDVSSPTEPGFPGGAEAGAGLSPTGCGDAGGDPVNFPDRLFLNSGNGRFADITGGTDGNYETGADNPVPLFHSFRTYDADFVDVNNDGYLDIIRADRALCAAQGHYFVNSDTSGDGVPDNKFVARSLAPPVPDEYWDNLATADVEGDGDLDLLISHSDPSTEKHALFINNGLGFFTLYSPPSARAADDDFTTYVSRSHDMYLVDLDGDRDQDILLGAGNHGSSGVNQVLLNRFADTGDLFFESVPIPPAVSPPTPPEATRTVHVGAADFNGDGRPDAHFVNYSSSPADRLFLNLGPVNCGSAAETACGDGLPTCSGTGLVVPTRICWQDASAELPEEKASTVLNGYGADYGDIDADGDLDILVTGLGWGGGNYLFINRSFSVCTTAADCPAGHSCVAGGCRPASASTTPKWWSCPQLGSGSSAVPCRDRSGALLTGSFFPAAQVPDRDLAVVFGDVDGDVDLDILWGRGQWEGPGWAEWANWPDAGPLLLIGDNEPPYVRRVTVYSGPRIVYQAQWVWNAAHTQIDLQPSTFAAAAPFTALRTQDLHIEVEFSEPMATATLAAVSPLGSVPPLSSSQPAQGRTIWRGTISNLAIADDGSHDGQHMLTIAGTDLVGHGLLRINSRASLTADQLRGTAGQDTIHGFRIGPLAGVIPVTALFMKQGAADPATPTIAAKALALQQALNAYYDEVSYAEISFAVTGQGWYQLAQPLAWYYTPPRTPLVDLVQEAVDDALAAGVDLSAVNYVLVVADETAARDEWSTTGGWPYTVGGAPRLLATGALNLASSDARVTHLAGRMVGLVDLFAHPDVTPTRAFVGPYSHMSDADREVHVLGWEKWRAGWLDETGTATGKTLTRVAKPPMASPIVNQTHTLLPLDSNDNGIKMVAIELADGLHYTAEYRRQQNLDSALPAAGVVLVKANDRVNQGEGPAIVQESPVTLGNLDDAPFVTAAPRNQFNDVGSGVNVEVTSVAANQAQIRLDYQVPATQNDIHVEPHDDQWETLDIWVDAPDLGLNFAADPRTVQTADEKPVIGYLNKVIGRVRNLGPADATNLEVELEILEPWGTGGTWRSLKVDTVPLLQGQSTNPSADYLIIADWTPTAGEHTCVKLRVRTVPNDVNPANNETQENIHRFVTSPGSPYAPVTSRFQYENPYNEPLPILFRLDGLPASWSYLLAPERPVLAAGATGTGQVTLQPPEGAELCTREDITLTAWVPRVDTLKRLGGLTLAVELKNAAEVTAETQLYCKPVGGRLYTAVAAVPVATGGGFASCRLETRGCTDPGLPNTQIAIVYTAPDGSTAVRYVVTDAAGCYVDVIPGAAPGLWQADVVLEEEECRAGDRVPTKPVFVPIAAGRARYLGVFTGGNWPLDGLDDYSASFTFAAQVEWPLSTQLRLGAQVGYHAFDAEPAAGVDNLGFTNVSALARWLAGGTTIRPFAQVGAGGYHADGRWDPGLLAGVGFEVPLTDSASLAAGVTAHSVNRSARDGSEPRWMDAYLGFFVALP